MAQVINTNVASLNAQRNLNNSGASLNTALQRLSSGLRINSAKDDAAGLAISERFSTQIRGLNQGARNANDGISLAQTAEGALAEVTSNLQRIRELSVQSANATNSATDRAALQTEVTQLVAEIERVSTETSFNGTKLLDGTFSSKSFQVGANAGETIDISSIASARTSSLGQRVEASTTVTISGAVAGLELNGDSISSSADAKEFATAVNNSGAGVTASANVNTAAGADQGTGGDGTGATGTITINGVTTSAIALGATTALSREAVVAAITEISGATGVSATNTGLDATGVTLTAADGRTITTSLTETAAGSGDGFVAASTGITVGSSYATVELSSEATIVVTGDETGTDLADDTDISASATGVAVSNIDITDVSGSNAAIASVDAALNAINSSRAELGAIQNRFDSVIRNVQTSSENLSASRSRIVDADFAAETAQLTKSQILQQAGTSILSQANSLPQNVLSLLQ